MKQKQNNTQHPVAAYLDGEFTIGLAATLPTGKIITVRVAKKEWVDRYNAYYEDTHNKELQMDAILQKMGTLTGDNVAEQKEAYKTEYMAIAKTVLPAIGAPNRLYEVRMRVVRFNEQNGRYVVEPTTRPETNKLIKYGY